MYGRMGYVCVVFWRCCVVVFFFFFQAEDGIRDYKVTGVQTCALPIYNGDQPVILCDVHGENSRGRLNPKLVPASFRHVHSPLLREGMEPGDRSMSAKRDFSRRRKPPYPEVGIWAFRRKYECRRRKIHLLC